jgi:hypothetical protein
MTLDHLYTLYRHTYDHYHPGTARPPARAGVLPPVARVVAEFAEADALDGRPLRTLSEFRMAVRHGAGALVPLGWSAA